MLSSVLLPHPLGPMSETISPSSDGEAHLLERGKPFPAPGLDKFHGEVSEFQPRHHDCI